MTSKKIWFGTLGMFAPMLDSPFARWANQLVRLLLIHLFLPLFERILRSNLVLDSKFRLLSRHSVHNSNSYNILYSDLDLSVVLSRDQTHLSKKLKESIDHARKIFVFIGELEIYTESEYERLQELIGLEGRTHQFLRDLRKFGWIEGEAEAFLFDYHRNKVTRTMGKILRGCGVTEAPQIKGSLVLLEKPVEDFVNSLCLPRPNLPDPILVYSPYLGFQVSSTANEMPVGIKTIKLSQSAAVLLLALTPFETADEVLKMELDVLRSDPLLRRIWQRLTEIEAIIISGVYRARPEIFPWMPEWQKKLESWLD